MVEFMKDSLLILGRIVTILPLLLLMTIFMGKRAIGQLPVFDFLIVVILGALVGADIADPNIKHLPTAVAIVLIAIFQRIVASWKISNRKVGRLLTFEPTVVIQNGKFLNQSLKKIRYSIDNILHMLREKNVFDVNDVETAIVEPDGALSVLKKSEKSSITLEDIQVKKTTSSISFPVIIEGKVYTKVLEDLNLNEAWLNQQLSNQEIHEVKNVFFATVNLNNDLQISLMDEGNITIPPIMH